MVGITRIDIISKSNWGGWRLKMSRELAPTADNLYRSIFQNMNIEILPGINIVKCTENEAMARYDWSEGIDVILRFNNGTKATFQEKFLTYHKSTVTFEEKRGDGRPGAWYYCSAQYYFVGYAREWIDKKVKKFHDWMLIDLAVLHRFDAQGLISWSFERNKKDGREATFRYIDFDYVPKECIVARFQLPVQFDLF